MSEFSTYITYKPTGGDALVNSGHTTIYSSPGQEGMYAARDIYLVDTVWVPTMTWENNTDVSQTFTQPYSTSLVITAGNEVTTVLDVAARYSGLSVTSGNETRTFSPNEASTTIARQKAMVTVPPKSTLRFYQKKYEFRESMFFIVGLAGQEKNVATDANATEVIRKQVTVKIMSQACFTTLSPLDKLIEGSVVVGTVPRADLESSRENIQRANVSTDAKAALSKMGV